MTTLHISPAKLSGNIQIQPSKAVAHRALICAALAYGCSNLSNLGDSLDMQATMEGLRQMGLANYYRQDADWQIYGGLLKRKLAMVDCGESGSTLRFLLPLALCNNVETLFTGRGRLMKRPMRPYIEALINGGAAIEEGTDGLLAKGQLKPGLYRIPGNVSSQYITGLLLALPLLDEPSVIKIDGPLESADYVALTEDVQKNFGIEHIHFHQKQCIKVVPAIYRACDLRIESDWSHAAFYLVAGFLGADICCQGLRQDSKQGDKRICDILQDMGGCLSTMENGIKISAQDYRPTVIDAAQIPDLVPILAVAACAVEGETRIINAARLRLKESDRLAAISEGIRALGGDIRETEDGLLISGKGYLRGGAASAWGDHRIAMALAIATSICQQEVLLHGCETVAKSAPYFWQEFYALGGNTYEYV